jgi:hypothetical protein
LTDKFPILTGIIGGLALALMGLVIAVPTISAFITLLGQLGITGATIGAIFKGLAVIWFGLKTAFLIVFKGILAWIGSTFIPALIGFFSGPVGWTVLAVAAVVAMVVLFREPIGKFLLWLGNEFNYAMKVLGQVAYDLFVKPWVDLWNNVLKGPVITLLTWIGQYLEFSMKMAYALAYNVFVLPWVLLWEKVLKDPIISWWAWFKNEFTYIMTTLGQIAYDWFVKPWVDLWNNKLREPVTNALGWIAEKWTWLSNAFNTNVVKPIQKLWTNVTKFLPNAMDTVVKTVQGKWTGMINGIKGAIRNVLQFIANNLNKVGNQVNKLIDSFNRLPYVAKIPRVPILNVPAFAKGGYVGKGTLAVVGEAGPEYIIPEGKMAAASANYLNGARGGAVIPAFANGGFVGGGGNAQINVTTGPVLQQGGQQYVTMADLEKAMRKTADGVYASLRTPASRIAMGRA